MIQSGDNFAHAMTAQLSWHEQICHRTISLKQKLQQQEFLQYFQLWAHKCLVKRASQDMVLCLARINDKCDHQRKVWPTRVMGMSDAFDYPGPHYVYMGEIANKAEYYYCLSYVIMISYGCDNPVTVLTYRSHINITNRGVVLFHTQAWVLPEQILTQFHIQ